jgi:hypothetical protein
MELKEKLEREKNNLDCIYLYLHKEFYDAFEQSAFALERDLWPGIRVLLKKDKNLGDYLRVGFPEKSLPKVLAKAEELKLTPKTMTEGTASEIVVTGIGIGEKDFSKWRKFHFSRQKQVQEQLKPFYGELPVYKKAYDFFGSIFAGVRNFPKELQQVLGGRLMDLVISINASFRELTREKEAKTRIKLMEAITDKIEDMMFLLRLASEAGAFGLDKSVELVTLGGEMKEQMGAWVKKTTKEKS